MNDYESDEEIGGGGRQGPQRNSFGELNNEDQFGGYNNISTISNKLMHTH